MSKQLNCKKMKWLNMDKEIRYFSKEDIERNNKFMKNVVNIVDSWKWRIKIALDISPYLLERQSVETWDTCPVGEDKELK